MAQCITQLEVSTNNDQEQNLTARHFKKINVNLNKGAGGKGIFLWYKKEKGQSLITRIQVTFNDEMAKGLINAGYKKIRKNLNARAGGRVYLWTSKRSNEYFTPIEDIDVTTDAAGEAQKFSNGWERVNAQLNRDLAAGEWSHIWVKRRKQTYICEVAATKSYSLDNSHFQKGFIRLDEDATKYRPGTLVFLWYRQTTNATCGLTDLDISTNNKEYQELQQKRYTVVTPDLDGHELVYMWYKKEQGNDPIKGMTLLQNPEAFKEYTEAGAMVRRRNINAGNKGTMFLCYNE